MERIFLSAPDISGRERQLVEEAFDSNYVAPAGPMISKFENDIKAYTGFENAIALTTGTAALHLCMIVSGIGKGDGVWTSSATFMGGVAPAVYMGAIPSFVDSDISSWTMDTNVLAEALETANKKNNLPKAIVSTDLYGQSCDLDAIDALCQQYDVMFFSDSAEALGAIYKGRHAGKGSKAAVLSFNGNKIISTSGGGMLLTDDKEFADRASYFSTQARQPFLHYEHTELGYNYRMSNISAAIGVGQLEMIEDKVERRRSIFNRYKSELGQFEGVDFMPEPEGQRSTNWLSCMTVDPNKTKGSSGDIIELCNQEQIEVRPMWKPMHLQPVFDNTEFFGSGLCKTLFETGLCLPSGSGMADDQQTRVIETILRVLKA